MNVKLFTRLFSQSATPRQEAVAAFIDKTLATATPETMITFSNAKDAQAGIRHMATRLHMPAEEVNGLLGEAGYSISALNGFAQSMARDLRPAPTAATTTTATVSTGATAAQARGPLRGAARVAAGISRELSDAPPAVATVTPQAPRALAPAPAPKATPSTAPQAATPPALFGRARVEAGIAAQFATPPAPTRSSTTPPTAPGALSDSQLQALADTVFGGGFSVTLSLNVPSNEGRQRLTKSLYFARLSIPALAPEFTKLAVKHPLGAARGVDRTAAASRQLTCNAWLRANGFEAAD